MGYSFIFAVDPGHTSGIAYGTVDWLAGASIADLINVSAPDITVEQIWERDEIAAGMEIATLFMRLRDEHKKMHRPKCVSIELVIEDFLLRPQVVSTKREVLAPVRVTAAIETMLVLKKIPHSGHLTRVTKRLPSDAMNFATNQRMKGDWDCFDVARGKPHGRDALRHWCTHLAAIRGSTGVPARGQPHRKLRAKGTWRNP